MARTQAQAVDWLNAQVGQHLDYDSKYGQQCTDFWNFYYEFLTGANPYTRGYAVPSARNIWDIPTDQFDKLPDSSSLAPMPGDVAIYNAAWGAGNGHVEVVVSKDANGCVFIGENQHNNPQEGVVRVYRTWVQMRGLIGVMRPRWIVSGAALQAVPQPKFTIVENYPTGKMIQLNKQPTNLWGMNYDFDYMKDHPVEQHNQGEVWTVTNKVKHVNGYEYYRRDGQVDGFNVLDCNDYTPAPPPPPVYVPPAAPVKGNSAEKYELLTELPYYNTLDDVKNGTNHGGKATEGSYFVWEKGGDNNTYYNLTTDNTKNQNKWINILSNKKPLSKPVAVPKPEPKPEPVKIVLQAEKPVETSSEVIASFRWFYESHEPVDYIIEKECVVYDQVHNGKPITIRPGKDKNGEERTVEIYGKFTKNGITYLRPLTGLDEQGMYYFYGIPTSDIYSGLPYLNNIFDTHDRMQYGLDLYIDKAIKTVEGIWRWVKKKI